MTNNFVAVSVETANPDMASICQVGLVTFEATELTSSFQKNVDPKDYFDPRNVAIHGISEETVAGSPSFAALLPQLQALVAGEVVVCHAPFDRVAINRATEKCNSTLIQCTWLDSARVARRTWPELFSSGGYGVANVAEALGVSLRSHVAGEVARATGEIMVRAMAQSGLTLFEWLVRAAQPISPGKGHGVSRGGNPDGPLAGEVVVFTGALSLPRRRAADLASAAGCTVEESLNKRTTLLIVGEQDIRRLAGHEISAKHRKAEQLIDNGQTIRILGEGDFHRLVQQP